MLNICVQAVARNVRRLLEGMEVSVCGGMDSCRGEWVSGRMDRWLDGQMDSWMDRWLGGQISSSVRTEMNC
jgi:hypothetical protein